MQIRDGLFAQIRPAPATPQNRLGINDQAEANGNQHQCEQRRDNHTTQKKSGAKSHQNRTVGWIGQDHRRNAASRSLDATHTRSKKASCRNNPPSHYPTNLPVFAILPVRQLLLIPRPAVRER